MAAMAEGVRGRLLFQDEGRFGRISDKRRCWAPLPSRPLVGQQVIREYVYALTAVSPIDGRIISLVMPWADAETMSVFLSHVSEEFADDFCFMVLDGAGWHRANDLRIPPNISLIQLPPYSPELNPVEHIWSHLREHTFGNSTFETLDEVVDQLCLGLHDLYKRPELVHSMTCFDWINTICLTSN